MTQQAIRHWMTQAPFTARPDLPVEVARRFMVERRIRHLPVVQDRLVLGIISDVDVERAPKRDPLLAVSALMRPPETVDASAQVSEVARDMARRKTENAVVVVERGRVVGIFTTVDALLLLARVMEDAAPARVAATGT